MASTTTKTRAGVRTGAPSFLQIILVVVIVVLLYSYWSVSSRNSKLLRDHVMLQQKIRSLAGKKISIEKKSATLLSQITDLSSEKEKFESAAKEVEGKKSVLEKKVKSMEIEVRQQNAKLTGLQKEGGKYKTEVSLLRQSINHTSSKLDIMQGKAKKLMEGYKSLKNNYQELLKKMNETIKERDECYKKLSSQRPVSAQDRSVKKTIQPESQENARNKVPQQTQNNLQGQLANNASNDVVKANQTIAITPTNKSQTASPVTQAKPTSPTTEADSDVQNGDAKSAQLVNKPDNAKKQESEVEQKITGKKKTIGDLENTVEQEDMDHNEEKKKTIEDLDDTHNKGLEVKEDGEDADGRDSKINEVKSQENIEGVKPQPLKIKPLRFQSLSRQGIMNEKVLQKQNRERGLRQQPKRGN
ncbi:protein GOLM2 [Nematostella vectensis]|uniref:protein GOLM2 n=1 Tax=Nematostella vectensis TaxID=45351 RepID=UPI0013903068|nr:protein GOLM2 [Nematostella vectensis]